MQSIPFSKYSGSGNDFILIDNRSGFFPSHDRNFIKALCHRNLGIGADGILLVENSTKANYTMRIFNADGSEAEMCGNGLRCFGRFIQGDIPISHFDVEVSGKVYPLEVSSRGVKVFFPFPSKIEWQVECPLDGDLLIGDYLDTGVPHVVIFTDQLDDLPLLDVGPKIRHLPRFSPKGTNVNFADKTSDGQIRIRTYERGVEGETLACGTGAAAVAIAARKKWELPSPITIVPISGESLVFEFLDNQIAMSGPAQQVFFGELQPRQRKTVECNSFIL